MHSDFVHKFLPTIDVIWSHPYFVRVVSALSAFPCIYWFFRTPSPGKAVTAMAVVAAIMSLRGEISGHEKFFWLSLLFIFLWIEMRAINKDRKEHDEQQAATRKEENDRFQQIADGLTQNIEQVTGGTTFCYLDIWGEQWPLGMADLRKQGRNPLYGVTMKLLVGVRPPGGGLEETIWQTKKAQIGDIAADEEPGFPDVPLHPFNLGGQESVDFNVGFSARNGFWHQIMYLRRVGGPNQGRWLKAFRIYKVEYSPEPYKQAKSTLIMEKVDDKFPMAGIAWNDFLLYHDRD